MLIAFGSERVDAQRQTLDHSVKLAEASLRVLERRGQTSQCLVECWPLPGAFFLFFFLPVAGGFDDVVAEGPFGCSLVGARSVRIRFERVDAARRTSRHLVCGRSE